MNTSFWQRFTEMLTTSRKPGGLDGAQINDAPMAIAQVFPMYEVQSPQYPQPHPYALATQGYKADELIFACISKRARAIAEAPLWVYDTSGETQEEIKDHPLRKLMKKPNPRMSERAFWQANQIYLDIAGYAPWEVEFNRLGEPINLWPMRPDWCSFYRGEGTPIRAIRYQPYGLPAMDVPIERVLLFQYFDPIYPLLKGLSPTAVCLRQLGIDNKTNDFLSIFMQRGAQMAGLLKTAQSINEAEAMRLRDLWMKQHGGIENWGDIAVLGSGAEYQSTQMNFRDMTFPDLDARVESRICMTFEIPPILLGAKVGLDRSTFSNYGEARKAWYEEWVTPQWGYLADETEIQMLPIFGEDGDDRDCEFMTRKVKALQEDKTAVWSRATQAAVSGLITRDEGRQEMGFDPVNDGDPIWLGGPEAAVQMQAIMAPVDGEDDTEIPDDDEDEDELAGSEAEQELEEKQFRSFASKRLKEGHPEKIGSFEWKFIPPYKRAILLTEVGLTQDAPFRSKGMEHTKGTD